MSQFLKAIYAFVVGLGTWGATAAADGVYDQVELWGLAGVVALGLGVYMVPNAEEQP